MKSEQWAPGWKSRFIGPIHSPFQLLYRDFPAPYITLFMLFMTFQAYAAQWRYKMTPANGVTYHHERYLFALVSDGGITNKAAVFVKVGMRLG